MIDCDKKKENQKDDDIELMLCFNNSLMNPKGKWSTYIVMGGGWVDEYWWK